MGLMDIVKKVATGAADVDGQTDKTLYCKAENDTDAL